MFGGTLSLTQSISAVLRRPVPGIATNNDAAGAASARVTGAVHHVQTALHQRPHTLLCHQHRHGIRVRQRTYAAARRGREVQSRLRGTPHYITLVR